MTALVSRRGFFRGSLAAILGGVGAARRASAGARGPARHVPWLAEVQRTPETLPADAPKLPNVLVDDAGRPVRGRDEWLKRREQVRRLWLDFLGPLPPRDARRPPPTRVLASERVGDVVRELLAYEAEPGEATEAYLVRPATGSGRRPGIVVLHSTVDHSIRQPAGVETSRGAEKAFALQLARRGYVTLCPRNFLWTETRRLDTAAAMQRLAGRHPRTRGMAKMLFDATIALDILAGRKDVDGERLGAVGHSLGGKEVLYLAALDERVKAAVSSEGGVGTTFSNWDAPWYLGGAIRDGSFAREHHELLALAAPRAFLLVGGDSADGARSWPFVAGALGVYELYGKPAPLGLFNHKKGHSVPPESEEKIAEWFAAYLPVP